MWRSPIPVLPVPRFVRAVARFGIPGVALFTAACSADVSRFDSPYFGLNESPGATGSLRSGEGYGGSGMLSEQSPTSSGGSIAALPRADIRSSSLPEPAPARVESTPPSTRVASAPPLPATQSFEPAPSRIAAPARPLPSLAASPAAEPGGGQNVVEVQSGDTLFAIARRHRVRVDEIRRLNNLTSSMIQPGQQLVLPGKGRTAPAATAARPAAPSPAPDAAARVALASGDGTYTMKPGDSLYSVARAQRISLAELQRLNDISDPRRVRVGTVLKLNADADAPATVAAAVPASAPAAAPASVANDPAPVTVATSTRPTIINSQQARPTTQVAAVDQRATMTDAAPSAAQGPAGSEVASAAGAVAGASSTLNFRWPATGRVLAKFGPRADGTHNDGIDIAVPLGAEVVAAESGVVAYAGNELKGFGNLVLIRHEGGWVTAYAHNDELLVARGDRIRRGQAIAKAGKTGNVDQPTLHFEVRQGSKPVDPMPMLQR